MNVENWKPITGYENLYEVSDRGRIKSLPRRVSMMNRGTLVNMLVHERFLKDAKHGKGYRSISICKNGNKERFFVHRIVAQAFLENPRGLPCVNHKDGSRTNNVASNLEWITYSDNSLHAIRSGLQKIIRGSKTGNASLSEEQVALMKKMYRRGRRVRDLVLVFKTSQATVSRIVHGRTWAHVS